jgi:carnitine O-acetyltransferase
VRDFRTSWEYRWSSAATGATFRELSFDLDTHTRSALAAAFAAHRRAQSRLRVCHVAFHDYGKQIMKRRFRASPDGVVQACFKLAYHRVHGWHGRGIYVYESCQTKRYLCGRTDVIRTTTDASNAWIDHMMTARTACARVSTHSATLLRASAARHAELAKEASFGKGVDRHLFALYNIQQQRHRDGGEHPTPALFTDAAWALSNHSVLSTSNLSSEAISTVAFGPVVQEGYGIAYCINNDVLRFGVSNFEAAAEDEGGGGAKFGGVESSINGASSGSGRSGLIKEAGVPTDARKFREALIEALREVRKILEL